MPTGGLTYFVFAWILALGLCSYNAYNYGYDKARMEGLIPVEYHWKCFEKTAGTKICFKEEIPRR